MPKFVEQIIENLDTDSDIENLLWIIVAFENPDFPDISEEEIPVFWHKTEAEIERDGHVW